MLKMFESYNVHATWATVGSLFADSEQQWKFLKPRIEPIYSEEKFCAYKWVRKNGLPESQRWAQFAPEIIRQIINSRGQELATHTFSHFYCLEKQSEPVAFENDLKAAQGAASLFNTKLTSLVFPRNQFNSDCLKVCYANGITAVRSNPETWFWSPVAEKGSNIIRKIIRTSDAYIQLGSHRTSYPLNSLKKRKK